MKLKKFVAVSITLPLIVSFVFELREVIVGWLQMF